MPGTARPARPGTAAGAGCGLCGGIWALIRLIFDKFDKRVVAADATNVRAFLGYLIKRHIFFATSGTNTNERAALWACPSQCMLFVLLCHASLLSLLSWTMRPGLEPDSVTWL